MVRFGMAGAPIEKIELGIVRAGPPSRTSAIFPGIVVLGPWLGTRFPGRGNRICAPQFFTGIRVAAIEEPPRGAVSAGNSLYQHAVGYDRPARGLEAAFGIGAPVRPQR